VRCDECKVEPLTPGHFCECCGRKLSLQERKALDEAKATRGSAQTSWGEPAPVLPKPAKGDRLVGVHFAPEPYVDEEPAAPEAHVEAVPEVHAAPPIDSDLEAHFAAHFGDASPAKAPAAAHVAVDPILEAHFAGQAPPPPHGDSDGASARCESCGGPAADGNLCPSCQQAFHALLDTNAAPPADAVTETVAPVQDTGVAPAGLVTDAPAASADSDATVVSPVPAFSAAPAVDAEPAVAVAPPAVIAVRPVPLVDAVPSPVAPADAPVAATSVIRIKTPPPPAAPVEPVPQAKAPKAAAPVAAVSVPLQRTSSLRRIGAAAAVIVALAAIGFPLGKLWLGQESSPIIREEQSAVQPDASPAPSATSPGVPAAAATVGDAGSAQTPPKPAPAEPSKAAALSPAPPKARTSAGSSNVTRTARRVPQKSGRQPVTPVRQTAVAAVPSPVAPPPAPEVVAPVPAAPAPAPAPPPPPVGPFFELRDVNETPRVATRVEPQVPDDLRDRQLNEVVIVRVLVTQTGHPLMINLLRKSKAGPSLDSAIVAAVKQWTFVPARKRGEAVSCWFHVGVPVTKAN